MIRGPRACPREPHATRVGWSERSSKASRPQSESTLCESFAPSQWPVPPRAHPAACPSSPRAGLEESVANPPFRAILQDGRWCLGEASNPFRLGRRCMNRLAERVFGYATSCGRHGLEGRRAKAGWRSRCSPTPLHRNGVRPQKIGRVRLKHATPCTVETVE